MSTSAGCQPIRRIILNVRPPADARRPTAPNRAVLVAGCVKARGYNRARMGAIALNPVRVDLLSKGVELAGCSRPKLRWCPGPATLLRHLFIYRLLILARHHGSAAGSSPQPAPHAGRRAPGNTVGYEPHWPPNASHSGSPWTVGPAASGGVPGVVAADEDRAGPRGPAARPCLSGYAVPGCCWSGQASWCFGRCLAANGRKKCVFSHRRTAAVPVRLQDGAHRGGSGRCPSARRLDAKGIARRSANRLLRVAGGAGWPCAAVPSGRSPKGVAATPLYLIQGRSARRRQLHSGGVDWSGLVMAADGRRLGEAIEGIPGGFPSSHLRLRGPSQRPGCSARECGFEAPEIRMSRWSRLGQRDFLAGGAAGRSKPPGTVRTRTAALGSRTSLRTASARWLHRSRQRRRATRHRAAQGSAHRSHVCVGTPPHGVHAHGLRARAMA